MIEARINANVDNSIFNFLEQRNCQTYIVTSTYMRTMLAGNGQMHVTASVS
jgi:hypothetical protein